MKIYFAGPDVFRPDASTHAESLHRLAAARGHVALTPFDSAADDAISIYAANLAMIHEADAVIANLEPFRGCEPDSGTCFEVGAAVALGKRVVAYVANSDTLRERVLRDLGGAGEYDCNGMLIEDFGLPLNLMLAVPCQIVVGDITTALEALGQEDALSAAGKQPTSRPIRKA